MAHVGDITIWYNYISLVQRYYKLYREIEGMNPVSSLWITGRNLFFGVWKKIRYVERG